MPSFPPPGITFVVTSHIFRTFLARSRYFSTFSSPFFSHLSILWNCLDYNFTALVFLVNYHKIRSSGPNFMVCSNIEVPQKFEVVIFKHVFQDMVIPPFISLKPTYPNGLPYPLCDSFGHALTIRLIVLILCLHILHFGSPCDQSIFTFT